MRILIRNIIALATTLISFTACESVNDERIPPYAVNLQLDNQGLWDTYGVHGYGQYRYFIKEEKIPSNYSFTALSMTGFGGILLISGYENGDYNMPLAYDLACPVEARQNTRISIDKSNFQAYCPKCGSRFDVCEGAGRPVYGKALELNYGMKKYHVFPSSLGGYTIVR